jgi:hypothetical protein
MTWFGKFLAATLVSFFLMIGALGSTHPTPLILLAILVWVVFVFKASSKPRRKRMY